MYQGPKYIEDFQHNTGTVFCGNGVSTNGQKNSKNVLTSVTQEGSGACVARCSAKNIFLSEGIKKSVQRWKKCIEKQGDYVEKWCYCKFYIFIEIKFVSVVRIIIGSPKCI